MFSVYVTCKDKKEARKIARALLEKKLIACANIFPVESYFLWHGRLDDASEFAILAKTTEEKIDAVRELIAHLHSYEVPVISSWSGKANAAAERWVEDEL